MSFKMSFSSRFRTYLAKPWLASALSFAATGSMYVSSESSGGWVVWWWFVLSVIVAVCALGLGLWVYRQGAPGRWWALFGSLWACAFLLLVCAALVFAFVGEMGAFVAWFERANDVFADVAGHLADLATGIGVVSIASALGGIGVLVTLGNQPLTDSSRRVIGEGINFLLAMVGAGLVVVLLGALAGTHLLLDAAFVGVVPLLGVPLLVGFILRGAWRAVSGAHGLRRAVSGGQ